LWCSKDVDGRDEHGHDGGCEPSRMGGWRCKSTKQSQTRPPMDQCICLRLGAGSSGSASAGTAIGLAW
jgi:hypothetical protein